MAQVAPDDFSRYETFNLLKTPYKKVDSHEINVDILYPKLLTKSPPTGSPILIRFHGGGLIAGSSLFPQFFGHWVLELAERHQAIIVSPDHRFLPEASASDVMDDLDDLWKWTNTSLSSYLSDETRAEIKPDVNRTLVTGDSSGGLLSILFSLSYADSLRATTAAYPMVDIMGEWYTTKFHKDFFGLPQFPESVVGDHVAKVKEEEARTGKKVVVSSDPELERAPILFSAIQNGLYKEYFSPRDDRLIPFDRLDKGARFPKGGLFVWHSVDDSICPIDGSEKLAAKVKELQPDLPFTLAKRPGEHGFDGDSKIDEDWLKKGLASLVQAWLK
ncbi:hypothetical protein H2200_001498 [Cladophialophora chaetospira]|uniref:Alpha/beta hydrolase fold-3 domain-containing protein n=1 Tax=Cladophialophora chaetospira TaxID=386627 RepID=A0AA38XL44_9EURO|nr:hypothetical protein H2200_001498 [Cladophialophora chaetospira]